MGVPCLDFSEVRLVQGDDAARNIRRQLAGAAPLPFRYRDRGTMVTIGRNAAVALLGRRPIRGFPGWLAWLGVHLVNLISLGSRLLVLVNRGSQLLASSWANDLTYVTLYP